MALTRKLVSVKIFTSNHFWTQGQRERAQITPSASPTNPEPKSCLRLRRSTNPRIDLRPRAFDPPIYELTNRSSTQSLRPTSLRLRQRSRAFAPRTHEPISLSLSLCDFDFLCDFDRPTNRSTFLCDFDFLLSLFNL